MNKYDETTLMASFEGLLQDLKAEVIEVAQLLSQPDDPDAEERATENEGDEVLEERGRVAQQEIAQIEAAIKRLKAGTYGDCTHCGEPISAARLDALPYAAHCIECETAMESGSAP